MEKINDMKKEKGLYLIMLFVCLVCATPITAQTQIDTVDGEVSYKTSQSIYVRFPSTKGISVGDTLFGSFNGVNAALMTVKYLSSTSCVGIPLIDSLVIEKGIRITARIKSDRPPMAQVIETQEENPIAELVPDLVPQEDPDITPEPVKKTRKTETLTGRLSAASYVNFSDRHEYDKQRMRYTFTMNAKNIGNTGLSAESYISFRHTINEWQDVKDHFGKAFKIYNLALQYSFKDNTNIWLGRKINFNISNVGAIDGLQAEKKWNKIFAGAFAGTRPDHLDYGFNADLLQFGAYVGHSADTKNGSLQSTLAMAEQRNGAMTDRRFAYFQHVNSTIKRFNLFTSFEFDLYTIENSLPKNTFNISSLYLSARYRATDRLSFFGSYDARKNIIYYETYKNFIDQLLEDETRQGFRFSFNYRPLKRVTLGSSAGYRFQKGKPQASKNMNSYLTVSGIPKVNMSATLSVVWIQSPYLNGLIYGLRASKDLIKGKLYTEAEYRAVKYAYTNIESNLKHSIVGLNLSWRLTRKFSLAVHYEGDIQQDVLSNSIYTNIIQRF